MYMHALGLLKAETYLKSAGAVFMQNYKYMSNISAGGLFNYVLPLGGLQTLKG